MFLQSGGWGAAAGAPGSPVSEVRKGDIYLSVRCQRGAIGVEIQLRYDLLEPWSSVCFLGQLRSHHLETCEKGSFAVGPRPAAWDTLPGGCRVIHVCFNKQGSLRNSVQVRELPKAVSDGEW